MILDRVLNEKLNELNPDSYIVTYKYSSTPHGLNRNRMSSIWSVIYRALTRTLMGEGGCMLFSRVKHEYVDMHPCPINAQLWSGPGNTIRRCIQLGIDSYVHSRAMYIYRRQSWRHHDMQWIAFSCWDTFYIFLINILTKR